MSNEITVRLKCSKEDIYKLLEQKKFNIVDNFTLDDTYFIPKDLNIKYMNCREILSKAVLVRVITDLRSKTKSTKLTFKSKQIDDKGDILKQSKVECDILNAETGKSFLEAIGYKELMNIKENDIAYGKDGLQMAIKDIENGELLMEVETVDENSELDTIEKIKQKISKLQIPIDTNDYFVKKAEIELNKIL